MRQVHAVEFKSKKEYTHYRLNFKGGKQNRIVRRDTYKSFVATFFDAIADEMLENENGVFIEDLGYFYIWMCPRKMVYNVANIFISNAHTDRRIFMPTFIPVRQHSEWRMDKTFSHTIKKKLARKIIDENKRYKMHVVYLNKKLQNRKNNGKRKVESE